MFGCFLKFSSGWIVYFVFLFSSCLLLNRLAFAILVFSVFFVPFYRFFTLFFFFVDFWLSRTFIFASSVTSCIFGRVIHYWYYCYSCCNYYCVMYARTQSFWIKRVGTELVFVGITLRFPSSSVSHRFDLISRFILIL